MCTVDVNVLYLAEDARLKFITKIYQIIIKLSIFRKQSSGTNLIFSYLFLKIFYIDIITFISSENWRENKKKIIIN